MWGLFLLGFGNEGRFASHATRYLLVVASFFCAIPGNGDTIVKYDACSFDATTRRAFSAGLKNIADRAGILGGSAEFDTEVGTGTGVRINALGSAV